MLKRILTFIQEKTSWLAILGLLIGTGLILYVMNWTDLPFSNPTIVKYSGGVPILDLRADVLVSLPSVLEQRRQRMRLG